MPKPTLVLASGILVLLATTAAAPAPGASRTELMAYSLGSAVALIMGVRIVIKLFPYLLKAAAVLAAGTVLWLLGTMVVRAFGG